VPHCHPIASQILFDDRFDVAMDDAFDKPNPPLYLAVRSDAAVGGAGPQAGRCAALPTLWPLVAHDERELTLVPVVSNPAAARALRDGEVDYAITNEASLAAFGLHSLRPLKHVIVRWLPVRRRGDAIVPGRMPALDGAARASDGVESSLRRSP
jgi:hypothetical protein